MSQINTQAQTLTVHATNISSGQDWATDPEMVEVYLTQGLLNKAEKCVAFMKENDVLKMTIAYAMGYEFFEDAANFYKAELEGQEVVKVADREFVVFEPEYRVEGCHAVIYQDGEIRASLPFKHQSGEVWFEVGKVDDLKAKLAGNHSLQEAHFPSSM